MNDLVILYKIAWPPLIFIGIFGNILNILVLQRRSLRSSTTVYLFILSISYLVQILIRTFRITQGFPHLMENYNFKVASGIYHVYIRYPICNMLVCYSNWLNVAMAFERCIVVGCVFKARRICTRHKAYLACFIILLLSIAVNLPRYFEYVPNYDRNRTGYASADGVLGGDRGEAYTYFSIVFVTFLPFGAMLPISVLIVALLTCHMRKQRALSADMARCRDDGPLHNSRSRGGGGRNLDNRMEANHRSVTILVIASNILYLFCFGLSVYTYFDSARQGRKSALANATLRKIAQVSDCLILVNASFSALLYCCCSSIYRSEARLLLKNCCRRSRAPHETGGFRPVTVVCNSRDYRANSTMWGRDTSMVTTRTQNVTPEPSKTRLTSHDIVEKDEPSKVTIDVD